MLSKDKRTLDNIIFMQLVNSFLL